MAAQHARSSMPRAQRKVQTLGAILENEESGAAPAGQGPAAEVMRLVEELEAQVECRISSMMSAAEDAILSMRNDFRAKMVLLPKKTRDMPLREMQEKNPEDFNSSALQEIRDRCAAFSEAAQRIVPATGGRGRTAAKRGAEPATALRTVRARRGAPVAGPSTVDEGRAAAGDAQPINPAQLAASTSQPQGSGVATTNAGAGLRQHGPSAGVSAKTFNGMPLQTPLPFAGSATAMPVTMLTQKRGGRTKAAALPDAAVVTTADGKQWALGKHGMDAIPETHRAEVAEMLSAQFEFLAAALGKTIFQRPGGRAGRKG